MTTFDPIIDKLVHDLVPKQSMTFRQLSIFVLISFITILVIILSVMKIRPDYIYAFQSGTLIWKPSIFFLPALSCLLLLATSCLPGRTIKKIYFIPFIISAVFFTILFIQTLFNFTLSNFISAVTDPKAPFCFGIIIIGGCIILAFLWNLWIKKSAPENATHTGIYAGLLSGLIAATAYAFHCTQDSPFYILFYYVLPVGILGLIGKWFGKNRLYW
ncbi:MAG: DUF1109 domain-containing protein [Alphaproteobacteria bacterium]|nr:DUF1109 domain-containing protein [Alphaproteobacteria bacterium]